MKKIILSIILVFMLIGMGRATAEVQYTHLYFEDTNGLKDSLEIALGMTDEEIGEIPLFPHDSILQSIYDSVHWVWFTKAIIESNDEGQKIRSWYGTRTYVYQPYYGNISNSRQCFYIPADRLPITISWDKTFFVDNKLTGSLITDNECWDAVGDDEEYHDGLYLADNDSCIFLGYQEMYLSYVCWGENLYMKKISLMLGTGSNTKYEGIDNTYCLPSATKIIRDGKIYIRRGEKEYTLTGQETR